MLAHRPVALAIRMFAIAADLEAGRLRGVLSYLCGCAVTVLFLGMAGMACAQNAVPDTLLHSTTAQEETEAEGVASRTPVVQPTLGLSDDEVAMIEALGHQFVNNASLYETFVRHISAIDPRFGDAAAVRNALRTGSAYNPQQLQKGIVAYAALLALRNPDFVKGVRALRGTSFADRLIASPEAVMNVQGADQAAWDVTGVLDAQGAALLTSGNAVTQAAYDVQHQPWSTIRVADQVQVLAEAKKAAAQLYAADAKSEKLLLVSVISAPRSIAPRASYAGPEVVHGLALAGLAVLGRTGDKADADVGNISYLATCTECLQLARINLDQCLAAAGPSYEDAFCLGRYAVDEASLCLESGIDGRAPLAFAPRPRVETTSFEGVEPVNIDPP